ncbi:MAG: HK97 gp10 family phage protein [Massilibacteroides sp.]|nr:HK97 gp10 family phage protein [Massilibacteroides sp.]
MNIKVTANLKNLKKLSKKIQKATLSKTAAEVFARTLRTTINQRTSGAGTGNLARSVKARKVGRYGYGVYADYYFWYANYGRRPGRPPSYKVAKIDTWAGNVGWTGKGLRDHIRDFGTRGVFFYETAKAVFRTKKPRIYKQIMKR